MKASGFLLICLFGCFYLNPFGVYAHDIRIARFELIYGEAGDGSLFIRFHREDIFRVLEVACESFEASNEVSWNPTIKGHILDNFHLAVDGRSTWYELTCIEYEEEFVLITGHLQPVPAGFSRLEVYNACMVYSIEDHSNIVSIKTDGGVRSFRLHSGRTTALIEY